MTKTYEKLITDVEMEEFVESTGLEEVISPPKPREKKAIEIVDDSVRADGKITNIDVKVNDGEITHVDVKVRKVNFQFAAGLSEPRTDVDVIKFAAEERGDFEEIATPEDNFEEALLYHELELENMWSNVGRRFGSPLEFEGNPFAKAKQALRHNASGPELDKDVREWLKQAEEYFSELMTEEVEEQKEETEAVVAIAQEANK
jgi:hypothetical protein